MRHERKKAMAELLAPAGNFEKLTAAVLYGADAVYLSGRMFGMRAAADNFSVEELKDAVAFAHEHHVRVYLTVNVMPREHEYPLLRTYFQELREIPIDALIIADLGVLAMARELLPQVDIHISTQANVVSSETCRAYQALGAKRIVLARELTMEEIQRIRDAVPDVELEAFIHGSMCVSYSGRCLLSNFFTGRDANRGMCTQPCRWNYRLHGHYELFEEKRPDMPISIEEVNGEAFFMSSRDTCMIEHIPALMESGIDSFKIEGRIKSAYYAAVVTNTYRMAMDRYSAGNYVFDPAWRRELESVSHRPYHTGYYFDRATEEANVTDYPGYLRENAYLAIVRSYDERTGVAVLQQRNKFSVGDHAELLTPGKTGVPFLVDNLQNEQGEAIESVPHPQMLFTLKMPFAVKPGDILRAATE